jgi:RND family efflux transporter MFP subunit
MKFIPRQPLPPPVRASNRSSTTRFLRLQPADDVATSVEDQVRAEVRPLPAFSDPAPSNLTGSKRLRLRLDPQVATQSLPATQRLFPASPEPIRFEVAALQETEAPAFVENTEVLAEPVTEQAVDDVPPSEMIEAPVEVESKELAVEAEPVSEAFQIPPVAETVNEVWMPPGPSHAETPDWMAVVPEAALPHDEQPVAEAVATEEPVTEPAVEAVAETEPAPVNKPARPELRRAGPTLAHLSQPEQTLGRGFWLLLVLLVLILAGVLYYFAVLPHIMAAQARKRVPTILPIHSVEFVEAHLTNPVIELPVTGAVEASRETALYARASGYVKNWQVDIGDRVKAGQVLAEIDTPEIDHRLVEARATADQARDALDLAQNEADRWTSMAQQHSVSQQDADAKIASRNEAQAKFNAANAVVGQLADLEMFKEITAPYAGTITSRNVEVGSLVGVGPGPAGSELFRLIQTDPVRIFVNVPEANAPQVRSGLPAKLQVAAFPGRVFSGAVVRDAGALDSQTHTLRTEIGVANPDGALMPGTVADVRLLLFDKTPGVFVPANSIIVDGSGASVARLVPSDGREVVRLTPVRVGREFGSEVEILDNALNEGDRLVANPPSNLQDGMVVTARPYVPPVVPLLLPPKPSAPRV